jgi:hypothetical protein
LCDVSRVVAVKDEKAEAMFTFLVRAATAVAAITTTTTMVDGAGPAQGMPVRGWESATHFLRCGVDAFSSSSVLAARKLVQHRLMGGEEYATFTHLPSAASGATLESSSLQIHAVYIAATSLEAAWQQITTGFVAAERDGPLGFGVYVSHDIDDAKAHVEQQQQQQQQQGGVGQRVGAAGVLGGTVVVAAYVLLSNLYPVDGTEAVGSKGQRSPLIAADFA